MRSRSRGSTFAVGLFLVVTTAAVARAEDMTRDQIRLTGEMAPDLIRRVELQWEPEDEATGYELELSLRADFGTTLYSEKLKETKFSVDLLPGTYYYRVRAIDEHGRPGRWSPNQELSINARPPVLMSPPDKYVLDGPLPDEGIVLTWRTSGPGIHYLVEIRTTDDEGQFTKTIVKQEVSDTKYPFYPQTLGRFQWSAHTLGAGGDEAGATWEFEVLGDFPRAVGGQPLPAGAARKKAIRFTPPWWRGHWTLFAGYGQSSLDYSILDHDFRSSSSFVGFSGFMIYQLNWEWHDPVKYLLRGIPWLEGEWELDRQTVLSESVVLPRYTARAGILFDEWISDFRFTPLMGELGRREVGIYQAQSPVEALRSNAMRFHAGVGIAVEWKFKPFLIFAVSGKRKYEFGGLSGIHPVGGVNDLANRTGPLKSTQGVEFIGSGTIVMNPRIQVRGRLRYEASPEAWQGKFPPQEGTAFLGDDTELQLRYMSFDVSLGLKF